MLKILIAEDDRELRQLFEHVLLMMLNHLKVKCEQLHHYPSKDLQNILCIAFR